MTPSVQRHEKTRGRKPRSLNFSRDMDEPTFRKLRDIVYRHSGIALGEKKKALVCARVRKRLRALRLPDYRVYLDYLMRDQTGDEVVQLLDVIATNVTGFLREKNSFDRVHREILEWHAGGQRRLRLWSAGCSTGEEPYSLMLTVLDATAHRPVDVKMLATDISTRALRAAVQGVYDGARMAPVSPPWQVRYFDRFVEDGQRYHVVKSNMKDKIVFKRLNLANTPFPMRGPFDIIFCRNVMIYFDLEVRKRLLGEIHRLLKCDGLLVVGHAESMVGLSAKFKGVCPSVYRKE